MSFVEEAILLLLFPSDCLLISFSCLVYLPGASGTGGIEITRINILVLFLILGGKHSDFHH
jgi:hypothetical protein